MKHVRNIVVFTGILFIAPISVFSSWGDNSQAENNSLSITDKIFTVLSPFWKIPEENPNEVFSITMRLPIENEWETPIIPTGTVHIFDGNGNQLKWIGTIGSSLTSSGKLVDYIPVNEAQKTVEPEETKTFEITWLGIGDQYIEDGKPKIVFEKPTYAHREQTVPSIYFWEKIIWVPASYTYIAQANLLYSDTDGQEEKQETLEMPITIQYLWYQKTVNTGFLIVMSILLGMLAGFFIPKRKKEEKSENTIEQLEKEIEQEIQKATEKSKKKQTTKTK